MTSSNRLFTVLLAISMFALAMAPAGARQQAPKKPFVAPSGSIAASPQTKCGKISSYCLDSQDNFVVCDKMGRRIRVISANDTLVADWPLSFAPEVISCYGDGQFAVAGSGAIAILDAAGKPVIEGKLPVQATYATAIDALGSDVVVCVRAKTGYAIYRLDAKLTNPKELVKKLRGCCGQLDLKTRDEFIYVAANCNFRVRKYDRNGKRISEFGKKDDGSEESFKGCCEPKNVFLDSDGNIYAAESGRCCVKKFSPDGKYLGLVGRITHIRSCVRVAIAKPSNSDQVYMLDTQHNIICPVPPAAKSGK